MLSVKEAGGQQKAAKVPELGKAAAEPQKAAKGPVKAAAEGRKARKIVEAAPSPAKAAVRGKRAQPATEETAPACDGLLEVCKALGPEEVAETLESLTVKQLKDQCAQLGLASDGKKSDLIDRLGE